MSRTLAILSDFHIPFHSEPALNVALEVVKKVAPGIVLLGGDILDFCELSRYSKSPVDALKLQESLYKAGEILFRIRSAAPSAEFIYMAGNHEERLTKYLCHKSPELFPLDCLKIPNLLNLRMLNCQYIGPGLAYEWNAWNIIHGDVARTGAGSTAHVYINKYGSDGVSAHTHRLAQIHKRNYTREFIWVEGGCLCSMDCDYLTVPDWQQGMVILHLENGVVWPETIAINRGRALFRGTVLGD